MGGGGKGFVFEFGKTKDEAEDEDNGVVVPGVDEDGGIKVVEFDIEVLENKVLNS